MYKFGITIFLILAVSLHAQNGALNISKMTYGNRIQYFNARSMGMGGTGMADGTSANDFLYNPALGVLSTNMLQFTVKSCFNKYQEDRSFPYYDNFGGFVDYGSYVFNDNWYYNYSAAINYKIPTDLIQDLPELSIGLSMNPYLDFNYDYLEEVRTTGFTDEILAYNKIKSDGTLNEITANVSGKVINDLAVGLSLGMITGEIDQSTGIEPVLTDLENISYNEINQLHLSGTPVNIKVGAFYQANEFLALGGKISLPYTIEIENNYNYNSTDTTITADKFSREIDYPLSLGCGINYKFTNVLLARLNVDFEYTFWSETKDNLQPNLNWDDTYRIMVGVEHIFFDQVPFRVGFSYEPLREAKEFTKTVLTAGTGMVLENFTVELAGGVSSFNFNQNDMFDNGIYGLVSRGENAIDRVETDEFFGVIEINYFIFK